MRRVTDGQMQHEREHKGRATSDDRFEIDSAHDMDARFLRGVVRAHTLSSAGQRCAMHGHMDVEVEVGSSSVGVCSRVTESLYCCGLKVRSNQVRSD